MNEPNIEYNPIKELTDRIAVASPELLTQISNFEIPHLIGVTDTERLTLHKAVSNRFAQLNAEAMPEQKARW